MHCRRLTLLVILAAMLMLASQAATAADKKRVLVLHSYHRGLGWTDSITRGIVTVLGRSAEKVELLYEYMDTKRIADAAHLANLAILLRHKYQKYPADLIILSDDAALAFVLDQHEEVFGGAPVVFCGVNLYHEKLIPEGAPITGVVEAFSIEGTIDGALQLEPQVRQIYAVADDTITGKGNRALLDRALAQYGERLRVEYLNGLTMAELQQRVGGLPDDSVLLYLSYTTDSAGHTYSLEESAELISATANRPMYSFWDFHLGHGVTGGKLISGFAQGEAAANLGQRILAGEAATAIPVVTESPNQYYYDFRLMQQHGLKLANLPAGSILINRPPSLIDQYKHLFWIFLAVTSLLIVVIVVISLNLVRRRQAERSLRLSETRLRAVLQATEHVGFVLTEGDSEPLIIEFSPGAEMLFGLDRSAVLSKPLTVLELPGELLAGTNGRVLEARELVLENQQGRQIPVLCSSHLLSDPDGRQLGWLWVFVDVTTQKQADLAMRESEERFRELAQMLPEVIYELDREGRVQFINQSGLELFGFTDEQLARGLTAFDFFPEREHDKLRQRLRAIGLGRSLGLLEYAGVRGNGEEFTMMARSAPMFRDGEVVGLRGFLIDMTEQKLLEERMREAQRMESIGTLAGGIAHDFNNLLMGIQGRASLALMDVDQLDPVCEHLYGIEEYVKSAANLTKQLLGFARAGKYDLKATDINQLISRTQELFARTHKQLHYERFLAEEVWTVRVDRSQIEQVLLNLFINASQAMEDSGTIRVTTENVLLDEERAPLVAVPPGPYVLITVSDTGPGMDDETRQKAFEPFFTTRARGRGTGLGLASAYGIIKNHKGSIFIESQPGEGATLRIHLPAVMTPPEKEQVAGEVMLEGSERLLLVDDEEMVLQVSKAMLEKLGYQVLTAADGQAALDLLAREQGVDLVILDMIMPGLSGEETFKQLRQRWPELKVLLSSGYSAEGKAARIMEQGCNGFIQKPFDMLSLSQKIRQVLAT